MLSAFKLAFLVVAVFYGVGVAQEAVQTPSEKTKEAVDRLGQAPAAITKTLEVLKGAVDAKLQRMEAKKTAPAENTHGDELTIPPRRIEHPQAARFSAEGKRDPFRPATMRAGAVSRPPRQNLSPLERFELGQLKVVGVVWDIKEPRAMIDDSEGLGYIVKVGTPMGVNEGKVKAIGRNAIVVEELYEDNHGARKKRDVSMRLATE
jgi:Tfp pilus assembly protein PilP